MALSANEVREFKHSVSAAARLALGLDQGDPVQRRAFVKFMDAAAAVAKIKAPKSDQPDLPLPAAASDKPAKARP